MFDGRQSVLIVLPPDSFFAVDGEHSGTYFEEEQFTSYTCRFVSFCWLVSACPQQERK